MNAADNYNELEKAITWCNKYNTQNMKFVQSTPTTYINALKTENLEYPVRTQDGFPYSQDVGIYWSGFYTSRPTFKKEIKTVSSLAGA